MRVLDRDAVKAAVAGGSVLAGGGGGWVGEGLELGDLAVRLGTPRLATLDEIPADGLVVTVSMVGAPAAPDRYLRPIDYVRAVELLLAAGEGPVVGFVSSENGALSSTNGWLQAAVFDRPVIDAPCNGRAHPTGKMGSLGLASSTTFRTVQAAVGGDPGRGLRLELVTRGTVARTATLVRQASVQAGGLVAVARTPLPAAELRARAAVGGVSHAIRIGEAMLAAEGGGAATLVEAIVGATGGRLLGQGRVVRLERDSATGFDVGRAVVDSAPAPLELFFCNEYMAVERDGARLCTFPDLVVTLARASGRPVSVAELTPGHEVLVLHVDRGRIPLGAGVWDPTTYPEVEAVMGKEIARYALARLAGRHAGPHDPGRKED
jgi:hypothetical protein